MNSLQFFASLFRKSYSYYEINIGSAILAYVIYILVTYVALSLVSNVFLASEFYKQIIFAGGTAAIIAIMMGALLPFVNTKNGNVCILLLYFGVIIMLTFLYLYFICGRYLIWFVFCYFLGLFTVAIGSWNRKRQETKKLNKFILSDSPVLVPKP